jgi:ATP-dependent protease ClpP protease subunit
MSSEEAQAYGMIDKVMERSDALAPETKAS